MVFVGIFLSAVAGWIVGHLLCRWIGQMITKQLRKKIAPKKRMLLQELTRDLSCRLVARGVDRRGPRGRWIRSSARQLVIEALLLEEMQRIFGWESADGQQNSVA